MSARESISAILCEIEDHALANRHMPEGDARECLEIIRRIECRLKANWPTFPKEPHNAKA